MVIQSDLNINEFRCWLKSNSDSVRTPAYIYSEPILDASFAGLRAIFPEDVCIFYSLKANPQPGVVRYLSGLGAKGETASSGELHMCGVAGLSAGDVLIGGVAKSSEYLEAVCEQGNAGVVIESPSEWRRLREIIFSGLEAQVLLRINPGVSVGGLDMAGESQFGLAAEQAIQIAAECRTHSHTAFLGLHFYFGSQRLSVEPVVKMVEIAGEVLQAFNEADIQVSVVDLGLGCGVPYLEKDTNLDMAYLRDRLELLWKSPTWLPVQLWTEAGRALVGPSGFYVSRVLEKKVLRNKVFIFVDGGLNAHNPGFGVGRFFRSNPRFLFIRLDDGRHNDVTECVDIVGNLCTSADSLGRNVTVPILEEGDLVVIPNSGAYCQTTALWGFNSQTLFSEAMLPRDGHLKYLEPQYRVLLNRKAGRSEEGPIW